MLAGLILVAAIWPFWGRTAEFDVSDGLKDLIPAHQVLARGEGVAERRFRYRLFVPEPKTPGETFPLIVWLHGGGESGRDNYRQMYFVEESIFTDTTSAERYRFAFLAPQCPIDKGWTGALGDDVDMLDVVMQMVDSAIAEHPINADRITAVGVSSGGAACWELANRHPDRFAGIAPLASSPSSGHDLSHLKQVPIWAFFSPIDEMMKQDAVVQQTHRVREAGGRVQLTFVADHPNTANKKWTHFCFIEAFRQYGLLEWLMAQSRASIDDPPPGQLSWQTVLSFGHLWPQFGGYVVVASGVTAAWAAVRYAKRPKRKKVAAAVDAPMPSPDADEVQGSIGSS
jgi:poly(3-hydroxybutyrate) depolymerase